MKETLETLQVKDLQINLQTEEGNVSIVNDLSFSLRKGEVLALVGESGCGKSMTALAITKLLPSNITSYPKGSVMYQGLDILRASSRDLKSIRGKEIAYIFQEPFSSFDPLQKIGVQICESFLYHGYGSVSQAEEKAIHLLELVGITDAKNRMLLYPNQFSGGMLQRASIAMALMTDPKLLIADEPTSAIDVTIQVQLIQLLQELQSKLKMSILFISHDIGLVSYFADRIAVMYAGNLIEIGDTDSIIENPKHPYTKALLNAYPKRNLETKRLQSIDGKVPLPKNYPTGCRFFDRCSLSIPKCKESKPKKISVGPEHSVECFLSEEPYA